MHELCVRVAIVTDAYVAVVCVCVCVCVHRGCVCVWGGARGPVRIVIEGVPESENYLFLWQHMDD